MILTKSGGHLASAKHLFHRKGQIIIPKEQIGEDDLMSLVLDAGAEDMTSDETSYTITTDPHQFEAVHKAIETKGLKPTTAEVRQPADHARARQRREDGQVGAGAH